MSPILRIARLATIIGAGAAAPAVLAADPAHPASPADPHAQARSLMAHPFEFSQSAPEDGVRGRAAGRGAIDAHARAASLLGHGGGLPAAGVYETGEAGAGDATAGKPDPLGRARAMILGQGHHR